MEHGYDRRILLSNEKECTNPCNNMANSQKCYVEQKKLYEGLDTGCFHLYKIVEQAKLIQGDRN